MEEQLTEDQINSCRKTFEKADVNKDGYIDLEGLKQAFRMLGVSSQSNEISEEQLKQYMDEFDNNNTGQINLQEFITIMSYKMKDIDTKMGTMEAFRFFDKDNSGRISRQQLKMVLMNMGTSGSVAHGEFRGNPAPQMKESEAEELLTEIDLDLIDQRGYIDYE